MLWNPKLNFPDVTRAEQLKAKETKKAVAPFDAVARRKKKEKEEQQQAKDDARVKGKPVIPEYSVTLADISASMAEQGGRTRWASGLNAFIVHPPFKL